MYFGQCAGDRGRPLAAFVTRSRRPRAPIVTFWLTGDMVKASTRNSPPRPSRRALLAAFAVLISTTQARERSIGLPILSSAARAMHSLPSSTPSTPPLAPAGASAAAACSRACLLVPHTQSMLFVISTPLAQVAAAAGSGSSGDAPRQRSQQDVAVAGLDAAAGARDVAAAASGVGGAARLKLLQAAHGASAAALEGGVQHAPARCVRTAVLHHCPAGPPAVSRHPCCAPRLP